MTLRPAQRDVDGECLLSNVTLAQLIERSREMISGEADNALGARTLSSLMNELSPEVAEVGCQASDLSKDDWRRWTLYATPEFTLCVFAVAHGTMIPFHDHPRMWVLMRVLRGRLQVCAYDWVERQTSKITARRAYDIELNPRSGTLVVRPDYGNVHQLLAVDDCVFLDLTFPPYSDFQGRDCCFYRVTDEVSLGDERVTRFEVV